MCIRDRYDTEYRFLKESPWKRLDILRERMPNVMIQMLLRASNVVGYSTYPDNVIKKFIKVSSDHGVDIYRIFDSMNCCLLYTSSVEALQTQLFKDIEFGKQFVAKIR